MLPSIMLVSLFAGERDRGEPPLHHIVFNNVTPEAEKSGHYFWSVYRCDALDNEDVSRHFHDLTVAAFLEDKLTIEAQQQAIDEDPSGMPLQAVAADNAALAARRLIAKKIREESFAESGDLVEEADA